MTIRIVPFEQPHSRAVIEIILTIQKNEFQIPIRLEDQPDLQDIAHWYQRGNGNFWVALEGDEVIGTIGLLEIGAEMAALRKMFVREDRRGSQHAIAGRLLATLSDWGRKHGLGNVYLGTTAKFIAAHRFYEKNGFKPISRSELPREFPVMAVDSAFFYKALLPIMESMPRTITRMTTCET